jgi:hypothetical protein
MIRASRCVMFGILLAACHHAAPARTDAPPGSGWVAACDSARPPLLGSGRRTTGALSSAERDSLLREVEVHRAAWRAHGITDYRIRVDIGCFCPLSPPAVLEVRAGVPFALRDTAGRPYTAIHEPLSFYTVEGLFDAVAQTVRRADVVDVVFDACHDYPASIRGDTKVGLPDDWFWTTATLLMRRR